MAVAALRHGTGEFAADAADQVAEGAQGSAGGEVVALADEDPGAVRQMVGKGLDQARLADTGLSEDEHHGSGPVRRLPRGRGQSRQLGLPLEDPPVHAPDSATGDAGTPLLH